MKLACANLERTDIFDFQSKRNYTKYFHFTTKSTHSMVNYFPIISSTALRTSNRMPTLSYLTNQLNQKYHSKDHQVSEHLYFYSYHKEKNSIHPHPHPITIIKGFHPSSCSTVFTARGYHPIPSRLVSHPKHVHHTGTNKQTTSHAIQPLYFFPFTPSPIR